ncbi:hypothetical protein E5K00_08845 [Hymenobacter aquaticus]|uniref:Uncharacterized protein n=1 Tax=Hymenobacter aquaticus TaxID=1867101 RepID=A0A4Z0Q5D5_9BACT|nr:hypothetical protein [Hymenobacter aquaticus]TGE25280.1 hypothetical protein E5K00_08845 [Hymenobacter aquaticus]
MLLYPIRRYRRPLLFPPGLLALAFLLLLGCWVINRNTERWQTRYALRLTMPQLTYKAYPITGIHFFAPYNSRLELERFRPWQTITFSGNIWQDYFSLHEARLRTQQLQEYPSQNVGLRIQFTDHATYSDLIQMLDQVQGLALKHYWLDILYKPTTLFVFGVNPQSSATETGIFSCDNEIVPDAYEPLSFWKWLGNYFTQSHILSTWAPLLQPDWRNSLYMLLLLALVSVGRLLRLRSL